MFNTPWHLRFRNRIRLVDAANDTGGSDDGRDETGGKPDGDDTGTGDEKLGEGGMKALKAEREANKQLKAQIAELSEKVKAFEDKDKTEAEKQAEQLAAAQKAAAESGRKAEQYEVAAAKGIPLAAASRLRGSTREEMEADADELLKLLSPKDTEGHRPPKPDGSQGKGGDAKPGSLSEAISMHYKH